MSNQSSGSGGEGKSRAEPGWAAGKGVLGAGWGDRGCVIQAHISLQHPSRGQCSPRPMRLPALCFPCRLPAVSG